MRRCLRHPTLSGFSRTPTCDIQTQTDKGPRHIPLSVASRGKNGHWPTVALLFTNVYRTMFAVIGQCEMIRINEYETTAGNAVLYCHRVGQND